MYIPRISSNLLSYNYYTQLNTQVLAWWLFTYVYPRRPPLKSRFPSSQKVLSCFCQHRNPRSGFFCSMKENLSRSFTWFGWITGLLFFLLSSFLWYESTTIYPFFHLWEISIASSFWLSWISWYRWIFCIIINLRGNLTDFIDYDYR